MDHHQAPASHTVDSSLRQHRFIHVWLRQLGPLHSLVNAIVWVSQAQWSDLDVHAKTTQRLVYGTPGPDHTFTIPTMWQSLWNAMPLLTNMLGAFAAGPIADRVGRKWTFGIGSIFSIIGIAVVYIARDPGVFLAGKMVNAISLGICLTNCQIYVSEVTPLHLRGVALSAYTFSIVSPSSALYVMSLTSRRISDTSLPPVLGSLVSPLSHHPASWTSSLAPGPGLASSW